MAKNSVDIYIVNLNKVSKGYDVISNNFKHTGKNYFTHTLSLSKAFVTSSIVCLFVSFFVFCHFPDFECSKLNILFLQLPRQLRKTQAFPEMPNFRKCLRHIVWFVDNFIFVLCLCLRFTWNSVWSVQLKLKIIPK